MASGLVSFVTAGVTVSYRLTKGIKKSEPAAVRWYVYRRSEVNEAALIAAKLQVTPGNRVNTTS